MGRRLWIGWIACLAACAGAFGQGDGAGPLAIPALAGEPRSAFDPHARALHQFRRQHPHFQTAIQVGEKLTYSVRFGPIRAGEATIEVPRRTVIEGDTCLHILTTAESNNFFSTFFHVRDRIESFVTADLLQPRRFEKRLREGDFRADMVVRFDPRNHLAVYDDGKIVEILPGAHDILSAFFAVRARRMEPGDSFHLDCHADRKNYPLRTDVLRRERIEVPAGTFDCLVLEPALRTPGLFKQEGTLTVWLSDDERRIPVQMKSKLAIGSIAAVLTDIAGRSDGRKADGSLSGGGSPPAASYEH
ncbi:MAG: DUF3108 domain-containing protein [Candidatus Eisenbacteria bacterium]|uniref:DUF3108 domain-containing protein n=1 Tax=Eiseniibacteriota bacterium TaxID=2212470 RepID=A0A938BQP8_UNCEI|nr:DUF3108 domain-containing protein [Candidatus Eisenbacteria bacterium]